ncbi:MAG: hypothetical protein R2718_01355 [Solirubrobacterales bacterium]
MESATVGAGGVPAGEGPLYDDRLRSGPTVVTREQPVAAPATKLESLAIFLGFGIVYTLIGFHVVANLHVVNFDALDRLTRAFMVWYNDPPKLAAIGFSLAPIGTFVLVPFAAFKALVTSGLALPLSSAVLAAGTLVFADRMLAMADMLRGPRLLIVLLIGINPMFAFYGMNGTGDAAGLLFASFGLFCLLGWGRNGSPRYLIGGGLAFALACLTQYEYIFWSIFIAFLLSFTLSARDRDDVEVEGSVIAFLAPIIYAVGIWIFFNAIVLGDPFAWVSQAGSSAPVNAASTAAPAFQILDAVGNVLRIQLVFPVALVALPMLLLAARDAIGIGLAGLIAITLGFPIASAAIAGSVDVIELRSALPAFVAGTAGMAWVYFRAESIRGLVWALTIGLSVLALPLGWSQMETFPHQNLEQAFTRAIATNEDQEGTSSRGGFVVGIAPERTMAEYIDEQGVPDNQILTDNARTFGVIAMTGKPELFFDRVDKGDDVWREVLDNPDGKVGYMLVQKTDADLILSRYPGADDGNVPGLVPVVSNDRYALLEVTGATGSSTADEPVPNP